jgi:hypothetical protein
LNTCCVCSLLIATPKGVGGCWAEEFIFHSSTVCKGIHHHHYKRILSVGVQQFNRREEKEKGHE